MIDRDRLEHAFDAYQEAGGDVSFAATMGGFEADALLAFCADATRDVGRALRMNARQRATLAGTLACGVLLGAAIVRQGARA